MAIKTMDSPFEVLGIKFGNHEYAIDIDIVEIIVETPEITSVPNSKYFIRGIMNLRGRIVPVIDLRKVINSDDENVEESNVVVTRIEDMEVGFLVDGVTEVMWVNPSELNSAVKIEESKYFNGVIMKGNRLLVLLDVSKLINDEANAV